MFAEEATRSDYPRLVELPVRTHDGLPPSTASKPQLHLVQRPQPEFSAAPQLSGPTLDPVLAIHRGPDGFVPLATKCDGEWKELGAVDLSRPVSPDVVSHLDVDAYMGLNSSFRSGTRSVMAERWVPIPDEAPGEQLVSVRSTARTVRETGLPYAAHTGANLRWLNAAFVDMDCYKDKVGLSAGEALGAMIDLQDSGKIPPASVFVRSGRGVWALWLLRDLHNPETGTVNLFGVMHSQNTPQRASARAIALYAKVQRALADRLRPLGADLGATDGARFAPVPGTLKTGPDRRVQYHWQADQDGKPFSYTLAELATALGIPLTPPSKQPRVIREALPTTPETGSVLSEARRRGWLGRWQRSLGDFETLLNLRGGGFAQGHRNKGAFYYALLLSRAGLEWPGVEDRVRTYGAKCQPSLSPAEVRGAVRAARRPKGTNTGFVRNATWQKELGVTPTEASYLQTAQEPEVAPRQRTLDTRRHTILAMVRDLGHVPSCRDMARRLSTPDLPVNPMTISRDYKALGLDAERTHAVDDRSLQVA
jgi:hypothetical protein